MATWDAKVNDIGPICTLMGEIIGMTIPTAISKADKVIVNIFLCVFIIMYPSNNIYICLDICYDYYMLNFLFVNKKYKKLCI